MMFWELFTTCWRAFWSETVQLPYYIVMQFVRMLFKFTVKHF